MIRTPSYVYDVDQVKEWISLVQKMIPSIPLTFSVKANSFIVDDIKDKVSHIEVCSPGELHICQKLGINPRKIIYSGVMKQTQDICEAIDYRAHILTAESTNHVRLISAAANERNILVNVLLRISSGNQFGMEAEEIYAIMRDAEEYKNIRLIGFHYYSGTQKRKPEQLVADIEKISGVIEGCEEKFGYKPELVEYGPGLAVEYFKENSGALDLALLQKAVPILLAFAKKVPLGIEMGRFIAAGCGTYYTTVKDLKTNYGIRYAILDGGIHHIKYYGQIMALNSPVIVQQPCRNGEKQKYCLCGSLCTTADVLAKEAELQELQIGDVLEFQKCGAYSLTEASTLFLSRDMPCIYLRTDGELKKVRGCIHSSEINIKGAGLDEGEWI